ncbi:phage tail tape measure protein [Heyndrickxia coagulans]|uniref:phage tail tape measure protein n=1 Tax=Heyndrickxia coagulans TaxID=1398 RepID=UPI0007792D5D|nr:phage tail tape measure protein [Heyndrickxia coagulans]KYC67170.1 hypothetical protein B4100_3806 [Heyndrickxia coagulans]
MAIDLKAVLRLDSRQFNAGMASAARSMNQLRSGAGKVVGSLSAITGAAAAIGTAYSSVKKTMDFESEMSTIQALTGASNAQMKQMQDLAIQMGAKTKYSAMEAAQGIEELLKAGLTPAQVKAGGLQNALNLATAGGLELGDAAEIMSTALNSFKDEGLKAADAANILAGTANASATDVMDLKYSLSQVASVAAGVRLSFKDTNAALGLLANKGLKGSDAGTSLKTMLMNLSPSTKSAADMMDSLGLATKNTSSAYNWLVDRGIKPASKSTDSIEAALQRLAKIQAGAGASASKVKKEYQELAKNSGYASSAFYDQNGKLKPLTKIAGLLHDRLKNLTDEQRQYALKTMFGTDAIRAANILYKEGADGVKNFTKQMTNVTALEVAKKKMDNASGAVEQFKGAMETLQIAVLLPLMPVIKNFAGQMADWVSKLKPAQIASFADTVKTAFSVAFNVIKSFFSFVTQHWGLVSNTLVGAAAAVVTFKSAMTGLTIISAIVKLMKAWRAGTLLATAAELGLNAALLANPLTWIAVAIAAVVAAGVLLWKNWDTIKAKAVQLWGAISSNVVSAVHSMVSGVVSVYHSIVGAIVTATNVVKTVAIVGWHALVSGILAVVRPIASAVLSIFNRMKPGIMQIFNGIKAIAGGIWTAIKNVVLGPVILLYDLVTGNFRRLKTDAAAIFNNLRGAAGQIWRGIKSVIMGYVSALKGEAVGIFRLLGSSVSAIMHGLGKVLRSIWNGLVSFFTVTIPKIGSSIKNGFVTAVKNVGNAMKAMKTAVKKKFSEIVDSAKALPGKIGNGIVNKAKDAVHGIAELAKKLVSKFRKILGINSPSRVFTKMGGHIVQGLINGLSAGNLKQFGESVLKDFGGGVLKGWKAIKGFFSGLLGGGGSGGSGNATSWLTAALGATGTPLSWLPGLQKLVNAESGGNPNAVNPITVLGQHATGLLQMLPSTFAAHAMKGFGNILNPVHNAIAAIRYIKGRYGSVYNTPLFRGGSYKGYNGGLNRVPYDGFKARLHKDETVLTRDEARQWRNGRGGGTIVIQGGIHLHGVGGNLEKAADQLLDIMARKIEIAGEGGA